MRANEPSRTATLIAAATVFLARDPAVADLVPEGAAPWCARCLRAVSPRRFAAVRAVAHPALRWAVRLAERATVPGLLLHFMLRKRFIEQAVRTSLAEGYEQLVVVGAGFDSLAVRLASAFPAVRFVEVDHPATQSAKRLALDATAERPDNLHLVAADLARARLHDVLAGTSVYRAEARTVFVIEGLLMYLTDAEVAALLSAVSALARAPQRVIFTVMEPAADRQSRFHNATPLVSRLLARWGEPFKSALRRSEAAEFLAGFGLRPGAMADAEHLRARYLGPGRSHLSLAQGEMIVIGDR